MFIKAFSNLSKVMRGAFDYCTQLEVAQALPPVVWGSKVDGEFKVRLFEIIEKFNWTPEHADWLMACIAFESGETFSPSIKNAAGSGATGLIQFMPATAKGLGTTVERLETLTAMQQLDYVEMYFAPWADRIKTLEDMYMAILWPRAVGESRNYVLFTEGRATYRMNSGLDKNSDGRITKHEAAAKVAVKLAKGGEFVG